MHDVFLLAHFKNPLAGLKYFMHTNVTLWYTSVSLAVILYQELTRLHI